MRFKNEGECPVRHCDQPRRTRGLCGTHYKEHRDGNSDLSRYIEMWEHNQMQSVITFNAYKSKVLTILKGVDVPRKMRGTFTRVMLEGYANTYPDKTPPGEPR